jgi:hypothetical protein
VPFKADLTVLSVQFFFMTIIFTQPISNNYKNSQKGAHFQIPWSACPLYTSLTVFVRYKQFVFLRHQKYVYVVVGLTSKSEKILDLNVRNYLLIMVGQISQTSLRPAFVFGIDRCSVYAG